MAIEKTIKIKVTSKGAKRSVDSLDGSMRRLGASADNTNKALGRLSQVAAAVGGALAANQVIRYADAFTSAQNQIRQTTKTTEQLTQRTNQLFEIANRSRVAIGATAELYTQLTLSTKELNITTEQQLRLTETISKAFTVSGKSAAESAGAIRQLGQAFASGALRGDEFNSVAEGAPEIMRAIQKATGKTQGELRNLAAEGRITSEVLVKSLLNYSETIDEKADKSTKTFAQSMETATNNMTQFVGESSAIQGITSGLGDALVGLTENLDVMVKIIGAIGVVMAARFVPQIIAATAAMVKGTAVTNIYTGAVTRIGVASRVAATASRALSTSFAFLGGPAGVATLAASALIFFATEAAATTKEASDLDRKVKDLSAGFLDLTNKQREIKFQNLNVEAAKLRDELIKVNDQINEFGKLGGIAGASENALANLKDRARELEAALEDVVAKQSAVFEAGITKSLEGATEVGEDELNGKSGSGNGGGVDIEETNFLAKEQRKTTMLQVQLMERMKLNQAYNESLLVNQNDEIETAKAHSKLLLDEDKARLEARKQLAALELEDEIERINESHLLKEEVKAELVEESEKRFLTMQALFEEERLRIEKEAAQRSAQIEKQRTQQKLQTMDHFLRAGHALNELFGSKSEKATLKRRKREARINGAAGIVRAWAENSFYEAIAMTVAIAASTEAQIKAMESAGSGGKVSIPSISAGQQDTASRQEPIAQQSVLEFRGLSEVAEELRNLDPGEVLPVEYTQRIVASIDEFNRISGTSPTGTGG